MDIKINELSAKTFNWLGMNESVVKDVPEFECGSMVVTTPDEVTCERELVVSIALSGIDKETSGMGRDIDELISDSGVNSFVLKTKPGITSSKPAIVKVPADAGTINKLVIETDKDSTITVVMDYLSDSLHDEEKNKMFGVQTRIQAGSGSKVNLVQLLRHSSDYSCLNDIGAVLDDNARLNIVQVILDGDKNYMGCRVVLKGKGSSLKTDIGYMVNNDGRLDMNYEAVHEGKVTESEINAAGVLKNGAFKLFRGTIDFKKGAAGAVGNEKEDVLLLDDNVVNQTIPIILCAEEDVEGNHGATIGELDEQIMLYMQARGLSREQVYEEMSKARIKAVCNLIPDEDTKNMMSDYLEGEQLLENGGEQENE